MKIGDFGLAVGSTKSVVDTDLDSSRDANDSFSHLEMLRSGSTAKSDASRAGSERGSRHSVGIGTIPYMAPEIHYDAHYTNLVDMFSFGVILFEMCYPMATASERANVLKRLKLQKETTMSGTTYKAQLADFEATFPPDVDSFTSEQEFKLIKRLLDVQPGNRPSAGSLIRSGVFGYLGGGSGGKSSSGKKNPANAASASSTSANSTAQVRVEVARCAFSLFRGRFNSIRFTNYTCTRLGFGILEVNS